MQEEEYSLQLFCCTVLEGAGERPQPIMNGGYQHHSRQIQVQPCVHAPRYEPYLWLLQLEGQGRIAGACPEEVLELGVLSRYGENQWNRRRGRAEGTGFAVILRPLQDAAGASTTHGDSPELSNDAVQSGFTLWLSSNTLTASNVAAGDRFVVPGEGTPRVHPHHLWCNE